VDDLRARLAAALAGRYTIEREIGRGGMAIVFLAFDPTLGRQVAIKVLRPELAASLGPDRFLDEIKVAARLKHPYILKLHEAGEARGLLYFSMPYVEGETLRQRLARERTLSVDDALRVAQEVAEALDHAHRHNVIHRDIKPENILFEEGHAVVSDFGIAKAISEAGDRRTVPGLVLGTVDYMSPEQEQGVQELDGRTDIYSLGLVLYEMLVGQTPGPDSGVDSLTGKRTDVPVTVVRLLRTALARDRANRFPTAADLVSALEDLTRRKPVPASRLRWLVAAGVLGVFAVAAILWSMTKPPVAHALDPTHIAVLYFDDLSPGGKLGHIASGITYDLIEALARVSTLRVTSPDGVKRFRGRPVALDSVARSLGVGTIVAGSVAASGDRLRVGFRLIDPTTGALLASETFERPQGELFALQDTLTDEVSAALRGLLGAEIRARTSRAATRSPQAWELIQQARALREDVALSGSGLAAERLLRADSLAAQAEREDPSWGEPIVLRGWLDFDLAGVPWRGSPMKGIAAGVTTQEWLRRAIGHANRALGVRPGDGAALELRGAVLYRTWFVQGHSDSTGVSLADAERDLRAAAQVPGPSQARAWGLLSAALQLQGNTEQALDAAQRAYTADAFLTNANEILARLFYTSFQLERYADALTWCDTGRRRFPTDYLFLHCKLTLLGWAPNVAPSVPEAWKTVADIHEIQPSDARTWAEPRLRMMAASVIARAGIPDSAEHVIRVVRMAVSDDAELLYLEALARVRLNQPDSAVQLLTSLLRGAPDFRPYLRRDVQLRPLARHAGFQRLVGTSSP
jgi:TolB-like protein/tRNA A-37 threonylcarbamoyl transferase component Bud32